MSLGEALRHGYDLDPSILQRIQAREARVDVDRDVVSAMDHDNGTYLLVQSQQPGHVAAANDAMSALTTELSNDRFDPLNPRESLANAVNEVKSQLQGGMYEPNMSGAVVRFYHDEDGKRRAVAIGLGGTYAYLQSKGNFIGWGRTMKDITGGHDDVYMNADQRQITADDVVDLELRPGDRIILANEEAEAGLATADAKERFRNIHDEKDTDTAARMLVGTEPGNRDKVAIVMDVLRRRHGTAKTLGLLAAGATFAAAAGGTGSVAGEGWRGRWRNWRAARAAGATAAGAATGAAAAGRGRRFSGVRDGWGSYRDYYAEGRRQRKADRDAGTAKKLGLGAIAGFAGMRAYDDWANARHERFYERERGHVRYQEDPRYADYTPEMIDADIYRRREKKVGAIALGVAGALIAYTVLKATGHVDFNLSNRDGQLNNDRYIVPHINMSRDGALPDVLPKALDGDGLGMPRWLAAILGLKTRIYEYIPGHNVGQHVNAVPIQSSANPDQWVREHIDPKTGLPYVNGGTGGAPQTPPNPANPGTPAPTPAPVPAPAPTESAAPYSGAPGSGTLNVTGNSLYTNSYEGLIHGEGHQLVGPSFNGADAHKVFEAARQRFGDDFIRFIGHDDARDVYVMPNGDVGLNHTGQAVWSSLQVADFIRDKIHEVEGQ